MLKWFKSEHTPTLWYAAAALLAAATTTVRFALEPMLSQHAPYVGSLVTFIVNVVVIAILLGQLRRALIVSIRGAEDNRQLAAIVKSTNEAIISEDLNGVVTSWNPAAERIFGYTAQEMIGQPVARLAATDPPGTPSATLSLTHDSNTTRQSACERTASGSTFY